MGKKLLIRLRIVRGSPNISLEICLEEQELSARMTDTMDLFSDYSAEVTDNEESADKDTNTVENSEEKDKSDPLKEVSKLNDDAEECKTDENQESDRIKEKQEEISKLARIKDLCMRTDISALAKVDQILQVIDPKPSSPVTEKWNGKRAAEDVSVNIDPKHFKAATDKDDAEDVVGDLDSCVVCGLSLLAFKGDKMKEFHHYLSHGFRILKEFEVLKPDDSFFLMCNICTSVYPKKCHGNFRKHLIDEHSDRVVEIFRCV